MDLQKQKTLLKSFFIAISVYMTYLAIATSLRSNLFQLSPVVVQEPWFQATLIDFYFNIAIISAWVIYREKSWPKSLSWIVSFICLGSIATAFYVFLQLRGLSRAEGLEKILVRKGL